MWRITWLGVGTGTNVAVLLFRKRNSENYYVHDLGIIGLSRKRFQSEKREDL